jgi:hypothetical protein
MPNPDERAERYLEDTQDAVDSARQDQAEAEAAGDDPEKRTEARVQKYARDTRTAVRRVR